MELTSVVVYVEDGAVPATLEFYERALGLTRRFYQGYFILKTDMSCFKLKPQRRWA